METHRKEKVKSKSQDLDSGFFWQFREKIYCKFMVNPNKLVLPANVYLE